MKKASKTKPRKPKEPEFLPNLIMGSGAPFIITDADGKPWRICPQEGTAEPVLFNK